MAYFIICYTVVGIIMAFVADYEQRTPNPALAAFGIITDPPSLAIRLLNDGFVFALWPLFIAKKIFNM
jgi:hypothetical protein